MFSNLRKLDIQLLKSILSECYNKKLLMYGPQKNIVEISLKNNQIFHIPLGFYTNLSIENIFTIDYEALHDIRERNIKKFIKIKLREEQKEPVKTIIRNISKKIEDERPCFLKINMPCGFGKTVITTFLLQKIKKRTVVVLITNALVRQWERTLEQYGMPYYTSQGSIEETIERIEKKCPDILLVISKHFIKEKFCEVVYKNFSVLVIDESHKYNLNNPNNIKNFLNFYPLPISFFLSATPRITNDIYCNDSLSFAKESPIEKKLIVVNTETIDGPDEITLARYEEARSKIDRWNIIKHNLIEIDTYRITLITKFLINTYGKLFHRTIVLTKSRDVMNKLYSILLEEFGKDIVYIGDAQDKNCSDIMEDLLDLDSYILITTFQYSGTGLDLPNLDSMFINSCNWNERDIIQAAGRICRENPNSVKRYIFLFNGTSIPQLRSYVNIQIKKTKNILINNGWNYIEF
ncbi:DNA helicase [Carp edema virus]|nr:DNA helicase [Carp edema virus]